MVDKGLPIRLVVYSVAIVYLVLDLFLIAGPLHRAVFRQSPRSAEAVEAAKQHGVVARVYFQPILLSQVDRRVEEDLWRAGRTLEDVRPEERRLLRAAALSELIDLHLLRIKVRFNQEKAVVEDAEIEREMGTFRQRFPDDDSYREALAARGWSEQELRYRLAARLQQERYLEAQIEVAVSDEEARAWYEAHRDELAFPERVRARHIFRAAADRAAQDPPAELIAAKRRIEAGEAGFAELARELSEDPRTREQGGDLGWMQAGRLSSGLAEELLAMKAGERRLIRSELGWHLLEVLERKPRSERTYEEARADVLAALEAVKRKEGLKIYRRQLRERDKHKIEIFQDVLDTGK